MYCLIAFFTMRRRTSQFSPSTSSHARLPSSLQTTTTPGTYRRTSITAAGRSATINRVQRPSRRDARARRDRRRRPAESDRRGLSLTCFGAKESVVASFRFGGNAELLRARRHGRGSFTVERKSPFGNQSNGSLPHSRPRNPKIDQGRDRFPVLRRVASARPRPARKETGGRTTE